jgi:serine/threonine protein kinase
MTASVTGADLYHELEESFVHDEITKYFDEITLVSKGGFGSIYRAYANDTGMETMRLPPHPNGRLFALKKVHFDSELAKTMLIDEILNIKQCKLRSGVRYYGCFIDDATGRAWVVMNFITGLNLLDVVKTVKLTRHQKNDMAKKLAFAIVDCHSHGIVHRDIKPANVMITNLTSKTSDVLLVDFGLSCNISKCPISPGCARFRGSPGYVDIHDETSRGINAGDMTSLMQSDWWSYGQTIVFMYTKMELFVDDRTKFWKGDYGTLTAPFLKHIPTRLHDMLSRLTDPSLSPRERPTPSEIIQSVTKSS